MTIFTNPECFRTYSPRAIEADLFAELLSVGIGRWGYGVRAYLLRLECYLQVTGQTLSGKELQTSQGRSKLTGFFGALFSKTFENGSKTATASLATRLRALASTVVARGDNTTMLAMKDQWRNCGQLQSSIDAFESADLDEDRVRFWQGWSVDNRIGKTNHYELHGLHERLGASFTEKFFFALCDWQQGNMVRCNLVNHFAKYVADRPRIDDFSDPADVSRVVRYFLISELTSADRKGFQIEPVIKDARTFLSFLEEHLFGRSWASPSPKIPKPISKRRHGSNSKIRKTSDGLEVKYSLVTEIPLQISDHSAIEILLASIQKDVDLVERWAKKEVEDLRSRVQKRKFLAATGIVSRVEKGCHSPVGLDFRLSNACPERFNHAAATYESEGFSHLAKDVLASRLYPSLPSETAWELGIPSSNLFLAFAALLVSAHPSITPSFLGTLELFDKNGQMVGFSETDGGNYLIGEKRRRGAHLAQQRVRLNIETTNLVRDIIEITEPLRTYLRQVDNDGWRKLFLCATSLWWAPRPWRPSQATVKARGWLTVRLEALIGLDSDAAKCLASRFSLSRLRNSAGVLVYLKTQSVQRMAEVLGHKKYTSSLLSHYLPPPIQEFFVRRWVRLFQTGIICEAMRDSPLLLRASGFESMAQLDEFLRTHALRHMPAHLEDPELSSSSSNTDDCVVFGVEAGILELLLSLELAVEAATKVPCARALRWFAISKLLIRHLETQREQPEFHEMVRVARQSASSDKLASLIYE